MKCKRIQIWLVFLTVFLISGMALPQTAESLPSYIDEHNRFILGEDEVPFFPLGLYVGQCPIYDQSFQLSEIAASPFDTLMNYAINRCGLPGDYVYATDEKIESYLDQLELKNLKLIYSLKEYIPYDQVNELCDAIDIDSIQAKVGNPKIRDHNAVISWYLNDEIGSSVPADQAFCIQQLEAGYQTITENDPGPDGKPNHTVWSVHWNTDWLIQEAHTTDIVGVDPYPIGTSNPITLVSQMADAAVESGKPLWLVPQLFNWPGGPWPTEAEMRAMTYLAVNHGAKGLIYYWFLGLLDYDTGEFTVDGLTAWNNIKEIASEIDQLRSVFLSTYQTSGSQISCDNDDIDFKLMWEGNTYYLFAVNTKEETITGVSFQINLTYKPSTINVEFEGRTKVDPANVDSVNGNFTDDFLSYEVHVYQWDGGFEEKADFTANHTSGTRPLAVQFSDQSTRTIETAWAWNFGDGGTSTAQNPSHTYNNAGDFTVSLTVTGSGGTDTETKTDYIHVESAPATNTDGGGGGGCFISTAASGLYVAPPF